MNDFSVRPPRRKLTHTDTHRTCYKCDTLKSTADFTRRSNGSYFSACKACNVEMGRARRAKLRAEKGIK